ncbi:COG4223 family protein [Fulvimarina endophytica]|nr:hypothetical protein [Fulvimarina endophytica]
MSGSTDRPKATGDRTPDAAETFAKSEGMAGSLATGGDATGSEPAVAGTTASETAKPKDAPEPGGEPLTPPAEQPASGAPKSLDDAGKDSAGAGSGPSAPLPGNPGGTTGVTPSSAVIAASAADKPGQKTVSSQTPSANASSVGAKDDGQKRPVATGGASASEKSGPSRASSAIASGSAASAGAAASGSRSTGTVGSGSSGGGGSVPPSREAHGGSGSGSPFLAGLVGAALALVATVFLYSYGYLDRIRDSLSGPSAGVQDVQRLSEEVASLRSQVDESGQAASPVDNLSREELEQLATRISALETANSDAASSDQSGGFDQRFSELQASVTSADEAARQAAQSSETGRQELQSKLDEAIGSINQRLDTVEASEAASRRALSAAGLKSAIDSGSSFEGELQTFANAGGSQETVNALQPYAQTGIPTVAQLSDRWPEVEGRVSAALTGPGQDAPVSDQILAGFRSLVETRSTGEVPENPTEPDDVLAKLDNAIQSGDLQDFAQTWQSMPQDAQEAGSDYFADVQARLQAQSVLSDAISSTLSGNGGSSDGNQQTNQG